jgi:glycine cleavage system transcriptional repressor
VFIQDQKAKPMQQAKDYLVLTAAGEDRVGLVEAVSAKISETGCNIEESRMTVLGGQFAIIMLTSGPWNALSKLEGQLEALGRQLGLAIIHKRTKEKERREPTIPYHVEAVALDHPGIVHSLASFFARFGINIEELATDTYPAPHTGTPMFSVHIEVGVPASTHISTLRGDFFDYCDELNLDATFEPSRG